MDTALFFAFAAAYLALLAWGLSSARVTAGGPLPTSHC